MTHLTNPTSDGFATLLNGLRVAQGTYDAIRRQVEAIVPTLEFNVVYTAEHVYGCPYWDCLSDGDRRLTGQVIRDLVARHLVGLELVEWAHEYPLKYRRI